MKKLYSMDEAQRYLDKWKDIFRVKDWEIKLYEVEKEWRKTGDIKIDDTDKQAILMINNFNPKDRNLEALIVHELLHLKLWGMDQLIEGLVEKLFGNDEDDPKYQFAFNAFMEVLETTVEDLAKSFISLGGEDKRISYGRVETQVKKELGMK
jgi:hypothetical protein